MTRRTANVSARVTPKARQQLDAIVSKHPHGASVAAIIERGIELVAQELDEMLNPPTIAETARQPLRQAEDDRE